MYTHLSLLMGALRHGATHAYTTVCRTAAALVLALLAAAAMATDDAAPAPAARPGATVATDIAEPAAANPVVSNATADTGTVVVTVTGLQSTQGLVYASLFTGAEGFPDDRARAIANQSVPASAAANGTLVLTFVDIPPGLVALSILHDADGNGKMNTNFLGIPTEDYGFSQNPPSRFGPPAFDKAAAKLAAGETQQLVITLK